MRSTLDMYPASTRAGGSLVEYYLRALKARRFLVAAITALSLIIGVVWVATKDPKYYGSAQLLVNALPQEDQTFLGLDLIRDSGDSSRTLATAASIVNTREVAQRTAVKLGNGWTARKVREVVDVVPKATGDVLEVKARSDEPEEAAKVSNAFAASAIELRRAKLKEQAARAIATLQRRRDDVAPGTEGAAQLAGDIVRLENVRQGEDPTLRLFEEATPPRSRSGFPKIFIVFVLGLLGFVVGSAIALLLESTNRRVRDEDEVLDIYPLPVLARVPVLRRRELKPSGALPWTLPPGVREAFRTLVVQLAQRDNENQRVILLTSASSGDGKTTSAINLAISIALSGQKCVLLDLDLRKPDVGPVLGLKDGPPIQALLKPDVPLEDIVRPSVVNLSVMSPTTTEGDIALVDALTRRLPSLIAEAKRIAPYVVIDTAPLGEVSDTLWLIDEVDEVVLVSRPRNTIRASFELTRDLLERSGKTPRGILLVGTPERGASAYYGYGYGYGGVRRPPTRKLGPFDRLRGKKQEAPTGPSITPQAVADAERRVLEEDQK